MPRINPTSFTGIYIETTGNPNRSDYYKETTSALDELNRGHAGRTVIRNIEAACEMDPEKRVVISKTDQGSEANMPGHWTGCARPTRDPFVPFVAGRGESVAVRYNSRFGRRFDNQSVNGQPDPSLAYVFLGHELIHASRTLQGTQYRVSRGRPDVDEDSGAAEEELRTVGIGQYEDEYPSENAIRREHGLAPRTSYSGNTGTNLREPPERNSQYTEARLRSLNARRWSDM
ncbi:M91 family zinc metallopeptidase [Pseudomonas fragariae (ex Marin et al. 2024)]|uniref:M91 family zinc metallopeptidase n=2 Tax=Pseudomonas TaxID=286 RepID=UPI0019116532